LDQDMSEVAGELRDQKSKLVEITWAFQVRKAAITDPADAADFRAALVEFAEAVMATFKKSKLLKFTPGH